MAYDRVLLCLSARKESVVSSSKLLKVILTVLSALQEYRVYTLIQKRNRRNMNNYFIGP